MMKYKGYLGHVVYDNDARIFHGEVLGLKDIITFQGETVQELEQAFKNSVNDYLEWCQERGEEPEKTFSGKIHLRLSPELHAEIAVAARTKGVSINKYIMEQLHKK